MQVYKGFFAIMRRSLGLMIMYAAIFIAITVVVTNVIPRQSAGSYADTRLPVTVIDRDSSDAALALEAWLYEKQEATPLPDETEALQDALYRRKTWYVVFIPAGYGAALESGTPLPLETATVPGAYQTAYLDSQLQAYTGAVRAYLAAGSETGAAFAAAGRDTAAQVSASLTTRESTALPSMYYFFLYLCYGLGMVMIFGLSPALLAMNRPGVLARTSASALPLRRRNLQLGLAAVTLALACYAAFALMALAMYGGQLFSAGGLICLVNGFAFLLFSTALGLLVGQLVKNSNTISAIANVVILGMCFLGGIYVQTDLLSPAVQTVSKFLPAYWYADVVRTAANVAEGVAGAMSEIWIGIGMQLVFALAILSVALVVSRQKQRIA